MVNAQRMTPRSLQPVRSIPARFPKLVQATEDFLAWIPVPAPTEIKEFAVRMMMADCWAIAIYFRDDEDAPPLMIYDAFTSQPDEPCHVAQQNRKWAAANIESLFEQASELHVWMFGDHGWKFVVDTERNKIRFYMDESRDWSSL
jgi:hypothetical protein